jgi:predicted aspartyl protease
MPSFTKQVANLQQTGPVVQVQIGIGSALEQHLRSKQQSVPSPVAAQALIDTGATGTVVNPGIVSSLNLNPVGSTLIHTPSSSNVRCSQYLVRLHFPSGVVAEALAISAPLHGQPIQCLVGRDVLRHGVLIYNGYMQHFTLSF